MTVFGVSFRLLMLALIALAMSGCFPLDDGGGDELKDPHFLAGKSRFNSMDFDGAITSFERALISNPKSASAHLELGLLYEEKESNYAAAIYHFERHLALRPESKWSETVKQHVLSCKLQLAKTVSFALVSRQVQDEVRKLYATNAALLEQTEMLKAQIVEQAADFSNRLALATQVSLPVPDIQPQAPVERRQPVVEPRQPIIDRRPSIADRRSNTPQRATLPERFRPIPRPTAQFRSHAVRSGDTLAGIAKMYSVSLTDLQRANPYVEAKKLRVGQVLNVPRN